MKERLADGEVVVGVFTRMPSVEAVEIAAHAGCDFVIIDNEHTPVGWDRTQALLLAAEAAGTVPVLRVPNFNRDNITRGLDSGAHGVMVPQVESAEVARSCVAATVYGPGGTRGAATSRGSGWGARMPFAEYTEAANRATLVIIQVETAAGVAAVDAIAAVPGIDCVFIGLSDLAVDLGVAGQLDAGSVAEAVDRVIAACQANGVAIGVPVVDAEMAARLHARGARFLAAGDAGLFGRAVTSFVREVRPSSG